MYVQATDLNQDIFYQGDLVKDFPFFIFDKDTSLAGFEKNPEAKLEVKAKLSLVMVLSQTCDVQRRKNAIVCPVYKMQDFSFSKDDSEKIKKRKTPNKFSVLRSQKGHLIPSHVYCVIFNKPADADEWIRLKHAVKTEGVGTEKWNSQQANRFAKGDIRELPIELQAFEILKNNRETSQSIKNLIPTIKATNLRRLLTDPYVRNKIGLSVIDGQLILLQPQKSALKNLESLISIISSDSFVVDKIYYNRDRRRFINSIKLARIKIKTSIPLPSKKNTRAVLYKYNSLIDPRDKTPSSVGDKVKSIYNELQIVSLDVTPHASAFLLRALIEIAVKRYLKRQGIKSDNSDVIYVTTEVQLNIQTNESASCRYATEQGVAYGSMKKNFTKQAANYHAAKVTGLQNYVYYSFFVRCKDAAGNANTGDVMISFQFVP